MDFSTKLTHWYQHNKRDFPWRNTKNPYFIWLSEIILQQTRTEQGLPYYISFTKKFKTIQHLAKADEESVLKLWQGLGYYSRARNLHFTAKHIVSKLDGEFPNTYKELLKLKGIGDYTASAIASICYDEPCAVVDGNVYRVLSRYFGINAPTNNAKGIKTFKNLAQKLLPKTNFGLHNQAIMDFGATICTPKNTQCNQCIFNDSCFALQHNKVDTLPVKKKKINIKKRYFNYLVILSNTTQINIQQRKNKGIWQNLYEFPLIESEKEIHLNELLQHPKIKKLTDAKISLFNKKMKIHKLSHQHLYTKFWIINTNETLTNSVTIKQLKNYPVPTLINNFIQEFNF